MSVSLPVQARQHVGTKASKKLREAGVVPAVLYGAGEAPVHLAIGRTDLEKAWNDAGSSTVVTLTGLNGGKDVLIQEVAVDPVYGTPIHADLYAVRSDVAVEVAVELVFEGVAPAEKDLGGTLIKVMHEIAVEALPKNLPHEIVVDISSLKTFDDQIHVRDLALPAGVTAVTDAEEVVALVQAAQEEPEEEAATADVSAVEVEKKGKEEEGAPAE